MKPSASAVSQVVTLGECMAVLFPERAVGLDRAPSLRLDIAGTEANTAIGLARLGIQSRFISRVGDDPLGRRIRQTLEREGVDTRFLKTDQGAPTGVFFREPLSDGARRVYYYRGGSAASRLGPEDLPPEAFAGAKIVHLSGITPALSSSCAAAVDRAIEIAHQNGAMVSFDPNYRARLWDAATARATLTDVIRRVDVLLLSEEDASVLFPGASVPEVLRHSTSLGPTTVVLKRAERGATAVVVGERFTIPARKVRRVVDSVGAGDGFNAGFLAGLVRGWETRDSLELGAEIGALAVQKLGDYAGYPRAGRKKKSPGKRMRA
jgi:2-dehydro-3-deoxygluconokinase